MLCMKTKTRQELGKMGERIALDYLEKNGYKIIDVNFTPD